MEEFALKFQEAAAANGCLLCPCVTDALFETINLYKLQSKTPVVDATEKTGQERLNQKKINNTEIPTFVNELTKISEGDGLYVLMKPYDRTEKGRTDWVDINNYVKAQGGKWIKAGRDSRWEIPKKA